ncbi:dihydrolipoamide acetyltransferase family protein [Thalassolituus hydrocarboniclasticus]|jgi:2-oxoisovalerate dehydrogenase E2 component (dihydrolipoyl transacylase)|uniref:Dihydrolipoamide acetyltransferase component of pyruvate dehydrogenase complex n=1 Tax=Thalassolituus hydrocarboniclasticus TaxID=2742796 RepID=A0ABY6A9U0_9GAMM|nr:dihydrolipoamide acetyltransferase family protein [Thalassolituus hydrocarboniclasticus]UXD87782.1 2-oxo acid dehydrogenase subunit E2 [Thalassolituus hydrocarboniclasticus]
MRYFRLPDLGEGLADADIVEWHVKAGDTVAVDQLLLSVETAKAIVELPSPCAGVVSHCFGEPGDTVNTGEPLVEFVQDEGSDTAGREDNGSVVGEMPVARERSEDHFVIGQGNSLNAGARVRVTPSVRALARRLNVDIQQISGSGPDGRITADDVEKAGRLDQQLGQGERLTGVRKSMARTMALAHAQVVPVTLFDEADVSHWEATEDVSVRLVQAIAAGCAAVPDLNGWFHGDEQHQQMTRRLISQIDLGIAVDTEQGLFVPVLRDVANRSADDLRAGLDRLKADVRARTIPPREMQGATITLSNYGAIAGRYGTPVVVPPTMAILGAGRVLEKPLCAMGELFAGKVLPLSLTFDHRAVTGGEASRFLAAVITDLQKEPDLIDR